MKNTYRPLPASLTIKQSEIEGLGLFATEDILSHMVLGVSHYKIGRGYIRTPLGGFINHAEDSNCKKLLTNNNRFYLITKRLIKASEELTLTYTLYNVTYR